MAKLNDDKVREKSLKRGLNCECSTILLIETHLISFCGAAEDLHLFRNKSDF